MPAATGSFILPVFEQHLEMLGSCWVRRAAALMNPAYTTVDVAELDELVEVHVDGLAAAGEDGLPLLVEALQEEDAQQVYAATMGLLREGSPGALERIKGVFPTATGR